METPGDCMKRETCMASCSSPQPCKSPYREVQHRCPRLYLSTRKEDTLELDHAKEVPTRISSWSHFGSQGTCAFLQVSVFLSSGYLSEFLPTSIEHSTSPKIHTPPPLNQTPHFGCLKWSVKQVDNQASQNMWVKNDSESMLKLEPYCWIFFPIFLASYADIKWIPIAKEHLKETHIQEKSLICGRREKGILN